MKKIFSHTFLLRGLTALSVLAMIILAPGILQAENGDTAQSSVTSEEFDVAIQEEITAAIRNIIRSLEAQNAPVPKELLEILTMRESMETQQDLRIFEEAAERYFGSEWKYQLLNYATELSREEVILLVRIRVYLSSLIANANHIALRSPVDAEEIRAHAVDLLTEMKELQSDTDQKEFFISLRDTYAEIFPDGSTDDLLDFRTEVTILLAELSDAISILIDSDRKQTALNADLADLQSRLQLVDETQQLTAWLARFDAFAKKLLTHTTKSELPVLISDVRTLLRNLEEYLNTLQEHEIDTGTYPERVAMMRDELTTITTDDELDVLFGDLEDLLSNVIEIYSSSSESTE